MPLFYKDTQTQNASGAIADLLLSQGWTLMPDAPAFDPSTHVLEWDRTTHTWNTRPFSQDELTAIEMDGIRQSLKGEINTLRQWKDDADAAVAAWDGWSPAQRFNAMKTLTNRIGIFFNKVADIILTQ